MEVEDLTAQMRWVVFELQRQAEHEAHEREKQALRVENALLRFERRLPGGKKKDRAIEAPGSFRAGTAILLLASKLAPMFCPLQMQW